MSDEPKPIFTETLPAQQNTISAIASAQAPFIYFDGTPNFGFNNGIVNVTLEAMRFQPGENSVVMDRVLVAHLRMNLASAKGLRDALDKAIALGRPPEPGEIN